jgi:uncharacterized protein YegP (UPF0339 family)
MAFAQCSTSPISPRPGPPGWETRRRAIQCSAVAWGKGERGGIGGIKWYRQAKAAGGRGKHGAPYRYTTGCRCDPCRDARNAYLRAWAADRRRANNVAKARFVVRKGRTGMFRFNRVGPNAKVIATSQAYQSRSSALRGIESVRKHAPNAELLDQAGTKVWAAAPRRAC